MRRRRNKYGAVKTPAVWRGKIETFDSKAEARRAGELLLLERLGKISGLERQVQFVLSKKPRCSYRADFIYVEDGQKILEDVKGFPTPEFKVKWAWMQNQFAEFEYRLTK